MRSAALRVKCLSVASAIGALVASTATMGCARSVPPADLVLTGGKIVTVDPLEPEVEAVAISGYRIVAMGAASEMAHHVGPRTRVIDLDGRLALPGFTDSHGHLSRLGRGPTGLDLSAAESWEAVVGLVAQAAAAAEPGVWITGHGWHQEAWRTRPVPSIEGAPVHDRLSAVTPDNPVRLLHASTHASFVNARAMARAGITRLTPDPPGGTIVTDTLGNPTGLLRESAQRIIEIAMRDDRALEDPQRLEAERRRRVARAGQDLVAHGITSFHDAGASFAEIDLYRAMASAGELPVRLYVMVAHETAEALAERLASYRLVPSENDFLAVRAIKLQLDGALGSHGAWLLEPYDDLQYSTGLPLVGGADIARTAELAIQHGFQLSTHAVGDRANREALDAYEQAFAAHPTESEPRWRIEHAQHLHPEEVQRFGALGVIASIQGIQCAANAPWVRTRLGEARAASGACRWRDLLDAGVTLANGSGAPVEPLNPLVGFHALVTRRARDGTLFDPEQRLTREEALHAYTLGGALAAFEEHLKGSITPGKLADIVVLSKDIMTIEAPEIPTTEVDLTIIGGEVRYERAGDGVPPTDVHLSTARSET